MTKDKKKDVLDLQKPSGSRARNKTVMLTPDIASQMRSRINAGVHRSGSTEKIDASLLNDIRNEPIPEGENPLDVIAKKLENAAASNQAAGDTINTELFSDSEKPLADEAASLLDETAILEESKETLIEESSSEEPLGLSISDLIQKQSEIELDMQNDVTESVVPEESVADNEVSQEQDVYTLGVENMETNADSFSAVKTAVAGAATATAVGSAVEAATNGDRIVWEKEGKIIGFLVSYDDNENGDIFILRPGRLIVSNDASERGSMLILSHESVSPLHAIIRVTDKNIIVLDQLSENGTTVEKKDGGTLDLSGDKAELTHGDTLTFGEKSFKVCIIA